MKTGRLFSVKKSLITVVMICVLVLTAVLGVYFGVIKPQEQAQQARIQAQQTRDQAEAQAQGLILSSPSANYVINVDDPREVAGFADFVFIGRVEKKNEVEYESVFVRETEEGTETVGSPNTNYDITVLENLKGNLKTNKTFAALKEGGISMDGKYLIIHKGDFLPEEGDVCVFFVTIHEDGRLFIPGGKNSNVKIMESKLTENAIQSRSSAQAEQAAQDELEEITSSPIYEKMVKACENEIPFALRGERSTAPAEFLEETSPSN